MDYTQLTDTQRQAMLQSVGAARMEDLLKQIPDELRLGRALALPAAMDEPTLRDHLLQLARQNLGAQEQICFLGGGAYDHFIPAVVDALAGQGAFVTAYTPYQAEASQGSLQAFFEFQTMICQISGMDVANASLYEGATALAEAALMAINVTGKRQIMVSRGVHPHYRRVLQTYLSDLAAQYVEIPLKNGVSDFQWMQSNMAAETAAVLVQSPNYLGHLESVRTIGQFAHANQALCVQAFNPLAVALLQRPGEVDVDIAVAEGQPLGIPLSFGGPYLGLFACKSQFMRKMPGRLVGQTLDADGKRAFCLTLQTREQHIRREKATSNICTNQGLMALRAAVYLAALGPAGLRQTAQCCFDKTSYLADQLQRRGVNRMWPDAQFFNELLVQPKIPVKQILDAARSQNILAGLAVEDDYPEAPNGLLIAVTEKRSKRQLDQLVEIVAPA